MKQARQATLFEALIPIIFLIIILGLSLTIFDLDPKFLFYSEHWWPRSLGFIASGLNGPS